MPPPDAEMPEKGKGTERSRSSKDQPSSKDKARSSSSKDGKASSSKQSAAEIRAEEYDEFIKKCVVSHAAWLSTPLLSLSTSLSVPLPYFSTLLLLLFTLLLLLSPPAWIPHIAAPVVLLIPAQNTLQAISREKRKGGKGTGGECVQWIVFWVGWTMAGWVGEGVRVFRPGWRGVWEIGRVGVGIVLAGPWFSREALVEGKPSAKLAEAEKREKAEEAKAEKERAKAKAAASGEKQSGKSKSKEKDEGKSGEKGEEKAKESSKDKAKGESEEPKDA